MKHILTLAALGFATSCFGQAPDHVPTDGLVGWFHLDGNLQDEMGHYENPILEGATFGADRFGMIGNALFLDGVDDWAGIDGSFDAQEFSISFWVKMESETNGSMVHVGNNGVLDLETLESDGCDGFGIGVGSGGSFLPSGTNLVGHFACVQWVPQSVNLELGGWQHLSMTYDGSTLTFFRNGLDVASQGVSPFFEPSPSLFFGSLGPLSSVYFEGALDEIGLWSRALTPLEAQLLFSEQIAVEGCTDPQACNFQASANTDNGSCQYPLLGSTDCLQGQVACGEGTVWDAESQTCIIANPSDTDFDGCVGMTDLLDLLSVFGTCNEVPWSCGDPLEYQGYDYETVQIGEQCWFAENLRVTSYRNGEGVDSYQDPANWASASNGGMCTYGISSSNDSVFGLLYNWYAVDDTRGLCPSGWSVPTDGEWMTMEMSLGMSEAEANGTSWRGTNQGSQMKMAYGWNNGGNGTNSSGFSGLPGGYRESNGNFSGAGYDGNWWSSSSDGANAWHRFLFYDAEAVNRGAHNHRRGVSVRCIKDSE